MEENTEGESESFKLEPFIHQVGGHSSMLQLDDNTICKPLVPQELQFYQLQPESLKSFIPEFKGIVEVKFNKDSEGYLNLSASQPLDCKLNTGNLDHENFMLGRNKTKMKHRIKVGHSGSILIEGDADIKQEVFEEVSHVEEQSAESLLNPWVLRCHQEQVTKMRRSALVSSQKYILLENLTSKYEYPCILDLKMGTRPYGDDADFEKRQRQMQNMSSTTSVALGVRIGGMQVYRRDFGHYICHNKYYGRGLTVDGFHQALYQFLHNGTELCEDILFEILQKLSTLQEIIQGLDTFRFFTSSLLIIYDGKRSSKAEKLQTSCHNDTRHSNFKYCENGNLDEKDLVEKQGLLGTVCACSDSDHAKFELALCRKLSNHEESSESLVDVRMIDFAHSTQSLMSEPESAYVGPDDGYLFGLENLILQLRTFLEEKG